MLVGKINSYSYRPNFTRRLRENEKAEYNAAINDAKEYLGIENMSMILHGSCYPAGEYNTGIGTPFSKDALEIIKFEKLHGFNANQLGPNGEVTRGSISPYSGTVFARNHLFIDLAELTTDKYGKPPPEAKTSVPIGESGQSLHTLSIILSHSEPMPQLRGWLPPD